MEADGNILMVGSIGLDVVLDMEVIGDNFFTFKEKVVLEFVYLTNVYYLAHSKYLPVQAFILSSSFCIALCCNL